jgi:hypothetical protein
VTYGDCFHLSDGLATSFPVGAEVLSDQNLASLGGELMEDLEANAERKTINTRDGDRISYSEFFGAKSKPIIDRIDARLARLYGLDERALKFIQQYDSRFRMSSDGQEGSDE